MSRCSWETASRWWRLPTRASVTSLPAPAGNDVTLALVGNLHHLLAVSQLHLDILGQFLQQTLQCGRGEPRHVLEMGLAHRFQIDPAAHPAIENKRRLRDAKAPAQGPKKS